MVTPPRAYRAPLLRLPRPWSRVLMVLFVAAITAPLVGTALGLGSTDTAAENRTAANWPALPFDGPTFAAWPEALTRAFADRFAFRERLVEVQARIRVQGLATSPTPDVVLGRDGWLFYATDGALEDYTGAMPFTAEELEAWRTTLEHTDQWLQARGIAYVFVIAPDKHTVYAKLMPPGIQRLAEQARAAQLAAYLRLHSRVPVLDLTEDLRRAAGVERVYHRTDTHWNELGAHAAYARLLNALPADLGLHPARRDTFTVVRDITPGRDLARTLGLRNVLAEEVLRLVPHQPRRARIVEPALPGEEYMDARVVTESPSGPRAVIFRDSFASAMVPFLAEHFSRAVFVWQNEFDPTLVEHERPQLVVQQWVARHLYTAAPYDAVVAEGHAIIPR